MDRTELVYMSASRLAELIRRKDISPVEVIASVLARIERAQPSLNAFITVCAEQALEEAKTAEQAVMREEPLGPLHGVPFSVKDIIPTKDVRTTFGSLIFEDNVPNTDAVAVARAKSAGAILVGKTTTPEFGLLGMTEAPLFGRTCNAWSAERTCGGSSGGAAVAVAAGLTPLAIATDAGGSARIPAAANGVVGMKQSLGLVPHDFSDDAFGNMQYICPIARTVEDIALLLQVMAGPHSSDPQTLLREPADYIAAAKIKADLGGVRVAWRPLLGNRTVAQDVQRCCAKALDVLAGLGASIRQDDGEIDNPEALISVVNASYRRTQYSAYLEHHRDRMSRGLLRQFDQVSEFSADELWSGIIARTRLYKQVQSWFEHADIVVTPTLSRTALHIDQDFFGPIEIDGDKVGTPRRAWYPYTIPFNATGHPAVSIPCGWARDGMPVGLQLVARPGAEVLLFRACALFEDAHPWAQHRPALPEIDG
jgi:aspartyl-tRNA(Asn)/glutamyl-tRNA(Gln) amidotransferase subunit A